MGITPPTPPADDRAEPAFVIVWDPSLVSEEDYADLVEAVGNVVRAHGGLGVTLLRPDTFGVFAEEGVLQ